MKLNSAKSTAARAPQTPYVAERASDVELWEPPFERWLRLADVLLSNACRSERDQNQLGVQEEF